VRATIRWVVIVFGALILCSGALVLVAPQAVVQGGDFFLTAGGYWVAVGLRLALGILLWVVAAASRTPRVLQVLGALSVLGGFFLLVIGLERMRSLAAWGSGLDDMILRVVGLMAVGLGAFIIWSVWPPRGGA